MFLTIIQCFHSIQWFNQLLFNCNNYQPLSLLKMRETLKRSVLLLRLPNKKCLSSVTSLPPPSRIQCFHSQFLTISSTVASFSSVHVSNWSLWPKQTFLLANIGPTGPPELLTQPLHPWPPSQHAEQLLFSSLCSKVSVYSRKMQCLFFTSSSSPSPVSLEFIELVPS